MILLGYLHGGQRPMPSAYVRYMSKTPRVVPVQEDDRRLIAADEKTKRYILGIGKQRIAFDFTTRVTKLPPAAGDQPADVPSFQKKKQPQRRDSVARDFVSSRANGRTLERRRPGSSVSIICELTHRVPLRLTF